MKRAQTIAEAAGSKLLSPALNLWADDLSLEELYVARPGERALGDGRSTVSLSRRIRDKLLLSDEPIKILLTGQIGSGKSSELRRLYLDETIQERFEQIIIRLTERVDGRHADIRQLLVAIAASIAEHVRVHEFHKRKHWKLDESIGQDLQKWIKHLSQAFDVPAPDPGENPVIQFGAAFAKFSAKLRSEESYRRMIRDDQTFRVLDLVTICNHLIRVVKKAADRDLFLVIDDGDKVDQLNVARELFIEDFDQLARLHCRMVVTYPYALNFVPGIHQISGTDGPFVLQNIKVAERETPTEPRSDAVQFFRELLERRVDMKLVDDAALVQSVRYCAGIPREFVRIMRGAFEFAYNYEYERVEKE